MTHLDYWHAEKLGLIATTSDLGLTWAESHIQGPNALDHGGSIRVFFTSRELTRGGPVSRPGYFEFNPPNDLAISAVSSDPVLELGGLGHFDHFGIYPVSVMKDENGYLMAYAGWTRLVSSRFDVGIGLASSSDGKKFEKLFPGPILNKSEGEPFVISSPKLRKYNGFYYLFYIAGSAWFETDSRPEPVYKIRMARSVDLETWERFERDIIPGETPLESQASPDVIFLDGKYHMFFSFRGPLGYMEGSAAYQIGHATSRDLLSWTRSERPIFLDRIAGEWDSDMAAYPNVFERDGMVFMLYSGNGVGKSGVGLARLWPNEN